MRLPQHARQRSLGLNMTPMIDVVFLLIIFFLVSSHLAQRETRLELELPAAQSVQEDRPTRRPRVTINVRANGEVLLGTTPAGSDELPRRLRYELERTRHDLEVRIRGDRNVPYAAVEPILLACAEVGIWNVSFAVVEKQ